MFNKAEYMRQYRRRRYRKDPDTFRNYKRTAAYGPNGVVHFKACIKQQKNRCAICSRKLTRANQDHKHGIRKRLRGVLCTKCNTGLHFLENKAWFRKAVAYLKRWQ